MGSFSLGEYVRRQAAKSNYRERQEKRWQGLEFDKPPQEFVWRGDESLRNTLDGRRNNRGGPNFSAQKKMMGGWRT